MQIFNFEHLLCSNRNSYLVACSVKLFYEPLRTQRYKLLLNYKHFNMFKQRWKKTLEMHQFLRDIFVIISKTKGLSENLTAPRDATDIFPPETVSRSGKTPFVYNTGTKEFGKTCGAGSGNQ